MEWGRWADAGGGWESSGTSAAEPQSATAGGAAPSGTVTVYQFVDATGAAAAYDYLYEECALCRAEWRVGGGREFEGSSASAEALLRTVETGLPKVGGPKGMPPLLPTYLPTKGLVKGLATLCAGAGELQGDGWRVAAGDRWLR